MRNFFKRLIYDAKKYALLHILEDRDFEELAKQEIAAKHKDEELLRRFEQLTRIADVMLPEYRFKWPQVDWWSDAWFNEYARRFDEDKSHNIDRRWMVHQLLRLTGRLDGDTAECGLYSGSTSWLICHYNQAQGCNRTHFGFDSFSGLSEPGEADGDHWQQGFLSYPVEKVERNLAQFESLVLKQGWIPERFDDPDVVDRQFSFVHIDVDLYQPTSDSIRFFYPRMQEGGVIVCDDYGSNICPGATRAIDEYMQNCPEKMIVMSGGGGFIIKGLEVSG